MEFGHIPKEHWYQPDSIDETKATKGREKMKEENIIYGGMSLPRHCSLATLKIVLVVRQRIVSRMLLIHSLAF